MLIDTNAAVYTQFPLRYVTPLTTYRSEYILESRRHYMAGCNYAGCMQTAQQICNCLCASASAGLLLQFRFEFAQSRGEILPIVQMNIHTLQCVCSPTYICFEIPFDPIILETSTQL